MIEVAPGISTISQSLFKLSIGEDIAPEVFSIYQRMIESLFF
jgi:hypothetical protein